MQSQLDRLHTVLGLGNVRFGVLPMGAELAVTPQNSFQLYDDLAIVESFAGETVYRDAEAATHERVLDRLWREAVVGEAARPLIVRAAEALRGPTAVEDGRSE